MTTLQDALQAALDNSAEDTNMAQIVEANSPQSSNTEVVFYLIKAHGSLLGVQVRDMLIARGHKWGADASSYLKQLFARGLLSRAMEHTADGYQTFRYACLYPEYHRSVRGAKKKRTAKVVPTKRPTTAPQPTGDKAQAKSMVAGMNIGLAREVYMELQRVFNVGASE